MIIHITMLSKRRNVFTLTPSQKLSYFRPVVSSWMWVWLNKPEDIVDPNGDIVLTTEVVNWILKCFFNENSKIKVLLDGRKVLYLDQDKVNVKNMMRILGMKGMDLNRSAFTKLLIKGGHQALIPLDQTKEYTQIAESLLHLSLKLKNMCIEDKLPNERSDEDRREIKKHLQAMEESMGGMKMKST